MFDTYSPKNKFMEERRKIKELETRQGGMSNMYKPGGKFKFSIKQMSAMMIIALFLLSIPVSMSLVQRNEETNKSVKAAQTQVQFYMFPNDNQVEKGKSFDISLKMVVPPTFQTSSALIALVFDKTHLKLNSLNAETETGTNLTKLKSTTIEDANSTGNIRVFLAAEDITRAPGAGVNLGRLNFTVLSDMESVISLNHEASQVTLTNGSFAEIRINGITKVSSFIPPTAVASLTPEVTILPVTSTYPTLSILPISTTVSPIIMSPIATVGATTMPALR